MKITFEISDAELQEAIKEKMVENAVAQIEHDLFTTKWMTSDRRTYGEAIKEAVRALIKQNIDDLSDRAVDAAAKTLANKGIKKMMEMISEE